MHLLLNSYKIHVTYVCNIYTYINTQLRSIGNVNFASVYNVAVRYFEIGSSFCEIESIAGGLQQLCCHSNAERHDLGVTCCQLAQQTSACRACRSQQFNRVIIGTKRFQKQVNIV